MTVSLFVVVWLAGSCLSTAAPSLASPTHCGGALILIPLGTSPEVEVSSPGKGVGFDIGGDGSVENVSWLTSHAGFLATRSLVVAEPQIGRPPGTPIVVPFGKKPEVKFSQRVMPFDLNGDGVVSERVAWPIDGGFLVRDRNGDGQITSGKELYGDATFSGVLNKRGASIRNGFAALAHEANAAVIDEEVPLYHELKVWNDANQNGFVEEGELEPFSKYVKRLFLFYERSGKRDPSGNVLYSRKGQAVYADGEQRPIYSVILQSDEEQ